MTLRTDQGSGCVIGAVAVAATAPVELNSIDPAIRQPTKALDPFMSALPIANRNLLGRF
jgi:hypothetical protein